MSFTNKILRCLTLRQVALIRKKILSDAPTQQSLLESALNSPINIKHYTNEQNVFLLAAHLAEKILKNHAFQDGNKRTALKVADMFLNINGWKLQDKSSGKDKTSGIAKAHVAVATSERDAEELGRYYESIATKYEWTPEMVEFRDAAEEH